MFALANSKTFVLTNYMFALANSKNVCSHKLYVCSCKLQNMFVLTNYMFAFANSIYLFCICLFLPDNTIILALAGYRLCCFFYANLTFLLLADVFNETNIKFNKPRLSSNLGWAWPSSAPACFHSFCLKHTRKTAAHRIILWNASPLFKIVFRF